MESQFNRLKASVHRISFLAILFASLTVSAQQNTAPATVPTLRPESEIVLEEKSYWFLADQGAQLQEVLAVGKFKEASVLYRRQSRFFDVFAGPHRSKALTNFRVVCASAVKN